MSIRPLFIYLFVSARAIGDTFRNPLDTNGRGLVESL